MLLVVGVDVTAISVFTEDGSLLRAAGRRHNAIVLESAIIRVYWIHVDSQRVHEGLLMAARSLEVFWHLKLFVHCPDGFFRQLKNCAVCVEDARRLDHIQTVAIYIDYFDITGWSILIVSALPLILPKNDFCRVWDLLQMLRG